MFASTVTTVIYCGEHFVPNYVKIWTLGYPAKRERTWLMNPDHIQSILILIGTMIKVNYSELITGYDNPFGILHDDMRFA